MSTTQATVTVARHHDKLVAILTQPVNASKPTIWQVMTDHPGYADVADNLSKVEVLSGEGLGMQRRCAGPKGESWGETCDHFVEGQSFGFRVHTDAPDYPYPFAAIHGEWRIVDLDDGAGFEIEIHITPKGSWFSKLMIRLVAVPKFKSVLLTLGQGWAARMEQDTAS